MRHDRPTVLVIDDQESVRLALEIALEREFDVLTADGGPSALALLRLHGIDVVLLDLLLPEMTGLDLLSEIKAAHPALPVIVVTAVRGTPVVVEAMRRGAENYLTKPWEEAPLLAMVRATAVRPRGGARCVLLVSEDPESPLPFRVILEPRVPVHCMRPEPGAVRGLSEPWVAMLMAGADAAPTAAMVEAVYERYPGCPILVATAHPDALRSAQVLVTEVVAAPYKVGDVLNKLGLLVSGRWGYPALPFHVGDHAARAIEYLTTRYRTTVALADVAGSVGLSVDRLAHVFRDEVGMTMKEYSTRLRIWAGAHLLAESERKLEDIALHLGFDHASHFSRVFTDVMKLRPGEYRRQVREPVGPRMIPAVAGSTQAGPR
jgi:CheY-like chemotaxis protein/AraC-like DNA-binding protein